MNESEDTGFYWPADIDAPRTRVRAGQPYVPTEDHPRGRPDFQISDLPAMREAPKAPSVWADLIDFYLPFICVLCVMAVYFLLS